MAAGRALGDFGPEGLARPMSRSLALAPFEWKGHKVNLIDTPGYADFLADVDAALRIADLAVFVVSAVVTYTNIGFHPDFVARWLKAFITGWPVAAVTAYIVLPYVRSITAAIDRGLTSPD